MPLSATTVIEVRPSGSDTANGGAFDPGQTAGMFTDGAATSATGNSPVFTSASYNFAAGDVGAYLYIGAGTNWTRGLYPIVSVAANAATLGAAVGQAVLVVSNNLVGPNTVAGCATTASPTGATWSIDYSQQDAAQITYTDLTSTGTGLAVTSAASPFTKRLVGNAIVVTGGTNFNAGRYVIASVSGVTATVLGPGSTNITTGAGSGGTGGLGGGLATPGQAGAIKVTGNDVFIKYGASDYVLTNTTPNTAGGPVNDSTGGVNNTNLTFWTGYNTKRYRYNSDALLPTINAGSQTSITVFQCLTIAVVNNIVVNGNSGSSVRGFSNSNSNVHFYRCTAKNCTNGGFVLSGQNSSCTACFATGCTTASAFSASGNGAALLYCVATACTFTPFNCYVCVGCISYANTGATTDGFTATAGRWVNCTSHGNGRAGFDCTGGNFRESSFVGCIATGNASFGWRSSGVIDGVLLANCAGFNNTSGNYDTAQLNSPSFVTLTADPFTNAASGDFSLNNTAGGGAACRAAGFPGVLPGGLTTGYADIGAAQHQDSGGGGSGISLWGGF